MPARARKSSVNSPAGIYQLVMPLIAGVDFISFVVEY